MPLNLVIGSGHSGVAVACALAAQGAEVLVVDVGTPLEPERAALRVRLSSTAPAEWSAADIAATTGADGAGRAGTIRPFGSDFAFRAPVAAPEWDVRPAAHELLPSFAKGGQSNGWGASVLPFRDEDLQDWPIGTAELAPHYDAVAPLLAMAARQDDLASVFPAFRIRDERPLPLSSQARALLEGLARRRDALAAAGVHFGQSRQAVARDCRLCAMCLHGCPYGLIFNAGDAVERLRASGAVRYRPDAYALRFAEHATGVRLWVRSATGVVSELRADRLFVAAGVLPTALLVLRSLERPGRPVVLKDSQHFFVPMLHRWSVDADPSREPHHTLAQVFVEVVEPDAPTVHVQLYTYNDRFAVDMRKRFAALSAFGPLASVLSKRLIVAQGFLHSDLSPHLELTMRGTGDEATLHPEARGNARTSAAVTRAKRKLQGVALRTGLVPLTPLTRLGALGSSFHSGGTFPMRAEPGELETDVLGRLQGLRRVHLVDASVFPTIPATTIAFSTMANAHRIGTEAIRAG